MKKKIKKNILIKKNTTPNIVTMLCDKLNSLMKGMLKPPKYKAEITAEEMNMLMYSANR